MTYQIREYGKSAHITVPPLIKGIVPKGTQFEPELTEDGILYRVVKQDEESLPSWVKPTDD